MMEMMEDNKDNDPNQSQATLHSRNSQFHSSSDFNESPFMESIAIGFSIFVLIITFPVAIFFCFAILQEYERAVIYRLGRMRNGSARGPGIFFILPCIDKFRRIDLRSMIIDIPPQEILTRDSVTVACDSVIYYKVFNPSMAISNVSDYKQSTGLLAASVLRNVLGTKTLAEILSQREEIAATMKLSLDEATNPWGIQLERVELSDVRLPVSLQRAMAQEAEAGREARASVIAAEGEMKASRALKEAADMLSDNPTSLQLRYLQTLSFITQDKESTVIFPLPMNLLGGYLEKMP